MDHNNTRLALVAWLFCVVSFNAYPHEHDELSGGWGYNSTVSDEGIIDPELARWYFDSGWDFSSSDNEGNRASDDWRQGNSDWDLLGGFELCDRELFELVHDSCFDRFGCNKSCVVVYHCEGCFKNWESSKRFGEWKMIERDLVYLGLAFLAGVCCHKYVVAGVKRLFGWVAK